MTRPASWRIAANASPPGGAISPSGSHGSVHEAATGLRVRMATWGRLRSEEQRLNSSHDQISYAVFCLKKKKRSISSGIGFSVRIEGRMLARLRRMEHVEWAVPSQNFIHPSDLGDLRRKCAGNH